jgi:threonine/homoserine efflux transporter RhtA
MGTYLKQLFSESGEASFSRIGSAIALVAACVWVTYIVWRTRALPGLEGPTFFIAGLYGLGKAGETVQRILGNK